MAFSSPALEVLIVLLMCGAYLALINPQMLQAKSGTFFLLNLGIPENISGSNCICVTVMYLCHVAIVFTSY